MTTEILPKHTQALFIEYNEDAPYTLKDYDHKGKPSLYRLYLEMEDPTEYDFANKYLLGWAHWERLSNAWFFKPYVERWRKELKLKIMAKALLNIREEAVNESSRSRYAANKYLLEHGWEPTDPKKRGRPTKDEVAEEANRIASEGSRAIEDFNRLRDLN